jgi:hypothetical protein
MIARGRIAAGTAGTIIITRIAAIGGRTGVIAASGAAGKIIEGALNGAPFLPIAIGRERHDSAGSLGRSDRLQAERKRRRPSIDGASLRRLMRKWCSWW